MKIDWIRHAKEFLLRHGWKEIDTNYITHPIYPLAEDVGTEELILKFVGDFYGKAWQSYKRMIKWHYEQEVRK